MTRGWTPLGQFRRLRHVEERVRAKIWPRLHPGVAIGRGVRIGRGCRLLLDPRAHVLIGEGCVVDDRTTFAAYGTGRIELGAGAFVGHHCTLAAHKAVVVGEGTFMAELVSIRDHDHLVGAPPSSTQVAVSPVSIGSHVWLGAKVTVLRGATVGSSAIIGANSVVHGDIPARTVSAGAPARVLRTLDDGSRE